MKKLIVANTNNILLQSNDGMFKLIRTSGIGMEDTPWEGLAVRSYGLAEKHVVDIRLDTRWTDFNGDPVSETYYNVYVSHGMRSLADTLAETQEYIDVLQSAVDFAEQVQKYMQKHGWWID